MAAPSQVVYDSTALRRKVKLPEEAYRIARDFLEDVIDSTEFNRQMRALGVDLTEAYDLYRTLKYSPWLIEFEIEIPAVEVRYWEATRYYRYVGGTRYNWRAFEVRAAFPFPATWSDDRVAKMKRSIARLMDNWLDASVDESFPYELKGGRDVRTLFKRAVGIGPPDVFIWGEKGWGALGYNIKAPPITTGWEKGETDTLPSREVTIAYVVIDKTGKYSDFAEENPYEGEEEWTIPEEE